MVCDCLLTPAGGNGGRYSGGVEVVVIMKERLTTVRENPNGGVEGEDKYPALCGNDSMV